MTGTFFIIYDRQESNPIPNNVANKPPENATCKVLPAKPKTADVKARWSGNIETAKVAFVEAVGTANALECREGFLQLFPGSNPSGIISVAEGSFVEST